jgi:hypothetical protein
MWLLPSRRRPANLARFFEAFAATGGATPGMVIIDEQDWQDNQAAYQAVTLPIGWHYRRTTLGYETQGNKLAAVWNEVKDCPWLGLIGDDCIPETAAWDRLLVEALDGGNMISCDDAWQAPRRIGNCWVMSGELVRAVGYIFPPGLQHLFVDDLWEQIGRGAGCWAVRMDVLVRHKHVLKGEAPPDATHRFVYGSDTSDRNAGLWPGDTFAFERWKAEDRDRAIAAVKAVRAEIEGRDPEAAARAAARAARLKSRSVMIASPVHDKTAALYSAALFQTGKVLERAGVRSTLAMGEGCSNLPSVRNALCANFLASACDDLVFIDGDMGWDAEGILRLIASDKLVIGAAGLKKIEKRTWCVRFLPGTEATLPQDDTGAVEVMSIGTGVLKIAREALEAIIKARPDLKLAGDEKMPEAVRARCYRFFRFGDEEEGEDAEFCALWRSLGGAVWVDPEICLTHVGQKEFTGRLRDVLTVVQRG